MAQRVVALGGRASYRAHGDGSRSVYELNINYLDALGDPERPGESVDLVARRFLTSQAIMLALRGVPGIYFHSLFGSQGWPEGVAETGAARTVNRQKLQRSAIEAELSDPGSLRSLVLGGYRRLLEERKAHPAFKPAAGQRVLETDPAVFALARIAADESEVVLCLHNVSAQARPVSIDLAGLVVGGAASWTPIVGGAVPHVQGTTLACEIGPYETVWLANVEAGP